MAAPGTPEAILTFFVMRLNPLKKVQFVGRDCRAGDDNFEQLRCAVGFRRDEIALVFMPGH